MKRLLSAFLCCLVLAAPVCRAHAKDAPAKTEQQRLEEAGELYFSYKPEEALEAYIELSKDTKNRQAFLNAAFIASLVVALIVYGFYMPPVEGV